LLNFWWKEYIFGILGTLTISFLTLRKVIIYTRKRLAQRTLVDALNQGNRERSRLDPRIQVDIYLFICLDVIISNSHSRIEGSLAYPKD